ncbi:hypothetical protein [Flavobacterium aquiphilum]|uniref:hypothetical protein n=1 Tax=Flavobacterium aquiphilum TaxID=3003261 RepID=UPI00248192BA|nr:hypothetical protein [Flavobacterium aquiphilum]
MKKNILTILLLSSLNLVFSQKKELNNVVKINSVTIFSKVYDFQYERILNDKNSIQFGLGVGNNNVSDVQEFQDLYRKNFGRTLNNPTNTSYNEKTFSLNIDYKYYYLKTTTAPRGLYLSPSFQYFKYQEEFNAMEQGEWDNWSQSFNYTKRAYKKEQSLINLRALVGCQLIIANCVSLNPYFGPGFAFGSAKDFYGHTDDDEKGFILNYGVYAGFSF